MPTAFADLQRPPAFVLLAGELEICRETQCRALLGSLDEIELELMGGWTRRHAANVNAAPRGALG